MSPSRLHRSTILQIYTDLHGGLMSTTMSQSLRVANIFLSPLKGGVEEAHVNMARLLRNCGAWVLNVAHPESAYLQQLADTADSLVTHKARGFYDLPSSWRLHQLLKTQQIDVIVAHNSRACNLARRFKSTDQRLIGVSHGDKAGRMHGLDHVLVLTEHMRAHFIEAGIHETRLSVHPNLYQSVIYPPAPPTSPTITLGFMGRLAEEKGISDLLKAFAELAPHWPALSLRIAGDGPLLSSLRQMTETLRLSNRVHFDGWVDDKTGWFSKIDMVIVPSHSESFGIIILEAIAHGKQVIASSTAGPSSIFDTDELSVALFEAGKSVDLVKSITMFLQNPSICPPWIEAAQDSLYRYSISKLSEQLTHILRHSNLLNK